MRNADSPPTPTPTPEPKPSAKALFLEALEREHLAAEGADERREQGSTALHESLEAFLSRRAQGDASLIARVKSLLELERGAGGFFDDPARGMAPLAGALDTHGATEGPGTVLGPYTLGPMIGEGGFGRVYVAEQARPIRRRVALKIIKLGMDTRAVVARFEQERQALAMLDHPNIARVLDAGATELGRPYFVMEYVPGQSITSYCDEHRLDIRERLALAAQACRAVQHAHTKGLIHRDLKPGNILVASEAQDEAMPAGSSAQLPPFGATPPPDPGVAQAVVKVIDFGIAKAVRGRLTEATIATGLHQFMGTPAYMSPEQAEASPDIDTRTDIYSLGVLLYELLTGVTPFLAHSQSKGSRSRPEDGGGTRLDQATRRNDALTPEILRQIREVDPARPSTRLSGHRTASPEIAEIAERRRADPAHLGQTLRGELDWIVMKALEKDRARRYASAGDLAGDIERYLANQPVLAAPPGRWYRARKFVKRNKGLVATASLTALALTGGAIGTAAGFLRASQQRDLAVAAASRADGEAYAATVNLIESALHDPYPRASRARALAAALDQRPGSWEQRYLNARLDPWLWSTRVAKANANAIAVAHGVDSPIVVVGTSADDVGELVRLDPADGRILARHAQHIKSPSQPWLQLTLGFDPAGLTLLSADNGGHVVFSDALTLAPRRTIAVGQPVWRAGWSDHLDGFVLATSSSLVCVGLQGEPREIAALDVLPTDLAIDAAGRHAMIAYDGKGDRGVLRVDLSTGAVADGPSGCHIALADIPGSPLALVKHIDRPRDRHEAWVVGIADGSVHRRMPLVDQMGSGLCVAPHGDRAAYTPPYGNTLRSIDLGEGAGNVTVGEHGTGFVFAASYCSDKVAVSGSSDGTVKAWDTTLERGVRTIAATGAFPHTLVLDAAHGRIGHVNDAGIEWFDPVTGRAMDTWARPDTEGVTSHMVLLPSGDRFAVQTFLGEVLIRAADDGRVLGRLLPASGRAGRIRPQCDVRSDGTVIAGLDRVDGVHLFDAGSAAELRVIHTPDRRVPIAVKFLPGGEHIAIVASSPNDGTLTLHRVADGTRRGDVEPFGSTLCTLAIHPNGRLVAVGGYDGVGWIIDLDSRQRTRLLGLGGEAVLSLAFTPDGERVVAGVDPREIQVFDVRSGRRLLALRGPNETFGLVHVALMPDGTLVAASGNRLQIHPIAKPAR